MSQSFSLNKTCTRCPRETRREITLEEAIAIQRELEKTGDQPLVAAVIRQPDGTVQKYQFGHLCENCHKIVSGYMASAFKNLQKHSSTRSEEE